MRRNLWLLIVVVLLVTLGPWLILNLRQSVAPAKSMLLTDPFLQLPTSNSVRVVWFTEFAGTAHLVNYGTNLQQTAVANTTKLSRTQEDQRSLVKDQKEFNQIYKRPTPRDIWRHEAEISNLEQQRIPYRVSSQREDGQVFSSKQFTLAPTPPAGQPLKILLTSDHQLMPMTAANLQKVAETIPRIDAVFLAGDLQNIPDRASEWFDDLRGGAFFPCLQGRASYTIDKNGRRTTYKGGEIIQHAPLFPATGNHEIMGRVDPNVDLDAQFNNPFPRDAAAKVYETYAPLVNPRNDPGIRREWIKNFSFNSDTFNEIFTLPTSQTGAENYYAVTFGDIRLVSLLVTNLWRTPSPGQRGRFQESQADLLNPVNWGHGQMIFEPIKKGSPQYQWLEQELRSPEFQNAKYRIVMFHHPPHSLGGNIVPPYTDPVQLVDRNLSGQIQSVRYEYPPENDYIIRDVIPLLEKHRVQLVLYGHTHIWNRFIGPTGMHFLESSNVGNTYGVYLDKQKRPMPERTLYQYAATGDPYGLPPVVPTIAPLLDEAGRPLPYISSNDITVFSILDTEAGTVSSYRFDTREPDSPVIKFDEFRLSKN